MVEKIGKVGTFFSNTKCNPQKNSKYFFCQKREKFAKSGHTKKRQRKKNVYVNCTETRFMQVVMQCGQIGRFLKLLVKKLFTNVTENLVTVGAVFKTSFYVKTTEATFGQLLQTFGLLFIPSFGHTDCVSVSQRERHTWL